MTAIKQFTTLDVSPGERARYWNEMAALRYAGSTVEAAYGDDFTGQMLSWSLGPLAMLRPRTHACRVNRTPLAHGADNLILHLQCRGIGRYSQGGIVARLEPGDAVLCTTRDAYAIDLSRHETMVVEFPRRLLQQRFADVTGCLVTRLPGTSPSMRIFHDFLLSLWQQGYREEHHPGWEDEITGVFFDLLAIALRGAAFENERRFEFGPAQSGLSQKVQAIVEARLQDPQFSVVAIANECRLSVRAVQKVFATLGTTPSGYIQERRLVRAGEKLVACPEATITQIAFDFGFNDSAYFARCFRRRNGMTPREFRIRH
ncbi:MAG: helix-turn-helix domain-containing protein [Alteraurantiacibacter sp.]